MLRLALTPRWMFWHVFTLGAMLTCAWLAAWQWQRAGSALGTALNVGYGLQWPVFAIFFGVMWWRMLRMESRTLREQALAAPGADTAETGSADRAAPVAEPVEVPEPAEVAPPVRARTVDVDAPSPFTPRPASVAPAPVDPDSGLAAYNRALAQLAERDAGSTADR